MCKVTEDTMVQLVFVHGVATRSGPTLVRAVENRNTLFREIAFAGMDVNILSPTWGDAVPSINPKVFGTDEKVRSFSLGAGTGQRSEERRVGKEGVGTCRSRWSRDT